MVGCETCGRDNPSLCCQQCGLVNMGEWEGQFFLLGLPQLEATLVPGRLLAFWREVAEAASFQRFPLGSYCFQVGGKIEKVVNRLLVVRRGWVGHLACGCSRGVDTCPSCD